jgi:hypothetical protein
MFFLQVISGTASQRLKGRLDHRAQRWSDGKP